MGSYYSRKENEQKSIQNEDGPIHRYEPNLGFVGYGLSEIQSLQSLEKYLSLFFNIQILQDEQGFFIKTNKYDRWNIIVNKIGSIYKSYLEIDSSCRINT